MSLRARLSGLFPGVTVTIVAALAPSTPVAGVAQRVGISPRIAVMEGDDLVSSLGLRVEVGSRTLALYGQGGAFIVAMNCDLTSPPTCNVPAEQAVEALGGIRVSLPRLGVIVPALSFGIGALSWGDQGRVGRILEGEIRLAIDAFSWSDLVVGAVGRTARQSVTGGMNLTRDNGTYGGLVVGLLIPSRVH